MTRRDNPLHIGWESVKQNRLPAAVLWTPIFFAPIGAAVYFWIGRDFSFERFRRERPPRFYYGLVLPNLLVNWVLWIPVTFAIHAFPTPLQIQLSGLAAALFSLMLLAIGRNR